MSAIPIFKAFATATALAAEPEAAAAQACADCTVRESALLGVLDLQALGGLHHYIDEISLAPEARLYGRGEPGAAVYTVRRGVLRFERATERGERRIVRLAGPGALLGQEALLGRPHADEVVACTAAELCRLPRHLVETLGQREPGLLRELMNRWQSALDAAEGWASDLMTGTARWRTLQLLLRLTALAGPDGRVWMPRREDIGAMLGITVETASRTVSALRREGVLRVWRAREATVDVERLREVLAGEG